MQTGRPILSIYTHGGQCQPMRLESLFIVLQVLVLFRGERWMSWGEDAAEYD